jgi:bacillolysin
MKKHIPALIAFLICCTIPSLFAQKGFDKKKKGTNSSLKPTFSFEEVSVPKKHENGRMTAPVQLFSGVRSGKIKARVIRDQSGQVIWLEKKTGKSLTGSANGRINAGQVAYEFLNQIKSDLSLATPSESFEITSTETDSQNQTHIRMRQVYKNIPVYGAEIILHTIKDTLRLMNGRYFAERNVNVTARITKEEAEQLAFLNVGAEAIINKPKHELTKRFSQSSHELVIYHPEDDVNNARLTWHVTIHPNLIERWEYFVDAENGEILSKYNHTCGVDGPVTSTSRDLSNVERSFGTYQMGNTLFMIDASKAMFNATSSNMPDDAVGGIWTIDAADTYGDGMEVSHITSSNRNSWNPTAVSAHRNAGLAYDYFLKTFRRNSLNGRGGTIISVINIADEEDGKGMDNAFWNGQFMGYGNGRTGFKPLAGGLDVAGHEMTHGVIQNSANLEYQGQSGAINESMADVFAVLIDRDDWTIGEDVVRPQTFPSGALRSMSNPNQGGSGQRGYQPKTMSQYVNTSQDNGGVHINSGIPNYAFYQIASKIGREKSELIYYRALTQYLTRKSQFVDLRLALVQSATDLYQAGSSEVKTVQDAFDAVGIAGGTPNPETPTELPVNNGTDGILVVGADDDVLYQTNPSVTDIKRRSTEGSAHKPSVTDNGQIAYFVSKDLKIRAITLTGTAQEYVVSDEAIWDNVAISKDGKKLAALTADQDKSVYVYSFDQKVWKKFPLYNPTYSDGVTTGEVNYADAIVWDLEGENLVYDANNSLSAANGDKYEYWDVGFLKVWDNKANNFGDGTIQKLFTNLEKGENIGNPAFSKNSPNIISFDYMYEPEDVYEVLGVDINNGNIKTIYSNNTLGFPDYSRKDDQMIFNTESNGAEQVGIINLAADHISASGQAKILINDGKLAVWYGQGSRETTKKSQTVQFDQLGERTFGGAVFNLVATSSSGLPVAFERVGGGIAIQGNQVTMSKAGKATVRATQVGNTEYSAASAVDRTFCVNPTRPVVERTGMNFRARSQGADEYIWYSEGVEIYRETAGAVEVVVPGIYEVRAVTTDGCLSAASEIFAQLVLGPEPVASAISTPYPNPAKTEITLNGNWTKVPKRISFVDVSGKVKEVQNAATIAGKLVIPTQSLTSGIYILRIADDKIDLVYKILKE